MAYPTLEMVTAYINETGRKTTVIQSIIKDRLQWYDFVTQRMVTY